jgi:F0F1-type ATP synthase delta subunit
MNAAYYARALFALIEKSPKKAATYLHNLDGVLKKRGHQKLLPKIFSEYQKLQLAKERTAQHRVLTPEQERTRTLLELYRKLTQTA